MHTEMLLKKRRGPGVSCRRCEHYHVTWDPRWPHGCRVMGFKSHVLPHQAVLKTTPGIDCLLFRAKSVFRK